MSARVFLHRQFPVSPDLRPYVHCFGVFEAAAGEAPIQPAAGEECHEVFPADDRLAESLVPGGSAMLHFNLGDPFVLERDTEEAARKEPSHVVGPDTGRARMRFGRRVEFLGVMFRPGRAAPFLGVPVDEVAGRFAGLEDLWGRDGRLFDDQIHDLAITALRVERIEGELRRRVGRGVEPDPRFASLADLIARQGGAVRIESLSQASGLSRQHLAPGWMRTERVMMYTSARQKRSRRFGKSESTEYVGGAVVSLAADPGVRRWSGKLLFVGDLASRYGFPDVDGRRVPNFYKAEKVI